MLREELIERISRYFKLSEFEAEKIFDDVFTAIKEGVRADNNIILDNLGEFTIKSDNLYKTIEFTPNRSLLRRITIPKQSIIRDEKIVSPEGGEPAPDKYRAQSGVSNIEEEIKKSREMLAKIFAHDESNTDMISVTPQAENKTEIAGPPVEKDSDVLENESQKSFSDYFSIKKETEPFEEKVFPPLRGGQEGLNVIPPAAVELHKEIVSAPAYPEKESRKMQVQKPIGTKKRGKTVIYLVSFIILSLFVLLLLVTYPVIYKTFFKTEKPNVSETQTSETPKVTNHPETTASEKNSQEQTSSVIEGISKNKAGWTDEKYNVVYIPLENNRYTIQESSWNSESKAESRIKEIESKITGLTGKVIKADLGSKGSWYRVAFGEFNSLEEARNKAAEIRGKN